MGAEPTIVQREDGSLSFLPANTAATAAQLDPKGLTVEPENRDAVAYRREMEQRVTEKLDELDSALRKLDDVVENLDDDPKHHVHTVQRIVREFRTLLMLGEK